MTGDSQQLLVTDLGLVSAAGVGVEPAWRCVVEGRGCIGPVRSFDTRSFDGALGAELSQPLEVTESDRSLALLEAAAGTLSPELGELLSRDDHEARRTAVVLGTSKGAIETMAPVHRRLGSGGGPMSGAELRAMGDYRPGVGTARLVRWLGARGPRSTLALACASSSMAILQGAAMIRHGVADRAVVGGFDGFSPFIFTGFHAIGALSSTACRPFDGRRDGTVLGEGAALLVLESEAAARRRGARPRAVFGGGGFAADGVHLTAPDREGGGLIRALHQGLVDASVGPGDIDYINAHGTATRFNDAMECRAFERVFTETVATTPISSSKSIFGHTLGAAGALDAIICVLALERGLVPPTVDGGEEAEVEGWDFVPGRPRPAPIRRAVSTNSGFAGNNTALLFERSGLVDDRGLETFASPTPLVLDEAGSCAGGG